MVLYFHSVKYKIIKKDEDKKSIMVKNMDKEKFIRTEMLLGETNLKKLNESKILVIGIGGVGGFVVEALVRAGVGSIDLIDHDVVSKSNLNRQIIANTNTIGKLKVVCMKERIESINEDCSVNAYDTFLTPDNIEKMDFSKYNYVIDAIDMISSKIAIIEKCIKENVPIISSMGTGNKLDPSKLKISDLSKTSICPLARVMRYELRKRGINHLKVCYSTEEPIKVTITDDVTKKHIPGSISFVPSSAGLLIASEVVRDIIA